MTVACSFAGTTIGKRYARTDELGIPFAITVDRDTLDAGAKQGTVTVRERDSTSQASHHTCLAPSVSDTADTCIDLAASLPERLKRYLTKHAAIRCSTICYQI